MSAVAAATTALGLGTRFVHVDRAAIHVAAVQAIDCRLGCRAVCHFDECETAGLTRVTVGDDVYALHAAVLGECLMQVVLGRAEAEIANKDVSQVVFTFLVSCC